MLDIEKNQLSKDVTDQIRYKLALSDTARVNELRITDQECNDTSDVLGSGNYSVVELFRAISEENKAWAEK